MIYQSAVNLYDKDGIQVRKTVEDDILYLHTRLRRSDVEEVYASNHHDPYSALCLSYSRSLVCLTVVYSGVPVAMFGINADNLIGNKAVIWLLGTDELTKHRIRFARHSKRFVDMFLEMYPMLFNYVHDDNKESIVWLRRIGAKIGYPEPYGLENELFRPFSFERT